MVQALIPAVFGLAAPGVAAESVRRGRTTFRGMQFARHDRAAAFWLAVATYFAMGVLSLAGAVWIVVLSRLTHEW